MVKGFKYGHNIPCPTCGVKDRDALAVEGDRLAAENALLRKVAYEMITSESYNEAVHLAADKPYFNAHLERARALMATPPPSLPQDVIQIVAAARVVTYEDPDPAAIAALDDALAPFAERVPWDDDPNDDDDTPIDLGPGRPVKPHRSGGGDWVGAGEGPSANSHGEDG